ncbi:MAG: DNA (cytosine-5-)-methyltransferase [Halothece sp.]
MTQLSVGSLFAGIGGICMAFSNEGYTVKWANEFDAKACDTYRYNFQHPLYEQDIREIKYPEQLGYVDIITSGFPCQAFSIAGYRQGFHDQKGRGNLFFETARFIEAIQPEAYLLENVKNLVSHDKGRTFTVIRDTLTKELNYSFIPFILNSKDYGNVPQTRERIYIVGFKNEGHIVASLNENVKDNLFLDQQSKSAKFIIPEKIKLLQTIEDIITKKTVDRAYYYLPDHPYYSKLKQQLVREDTLYQWRRVYVRENKNKVCPTLTANMGTGGHNVPLVKIGNQIRKITPEECLAFQGFNPNFSFPPELAKSHRYKQAGNSVTVPVLQRIAFNIKYALFQCIAFNQIAV